ncbi:response regulator transcription factor [Streptomyces sp. 8K308]|uniref:response regulator transcription factor n=1 Tax=Streptomyces sp. 8K308 TaxID=2530388 RepID=UPI00104E3CE3|nr:response regulator transcription factor [Streptomyces sp. 8K308]TDC24972.1 response regulator transcription factor [Streptomyces sp. 8K308]
MGESALSFLGVSGEDERVYRHCLRRPRTTLAELCATLGLDPVDALPRLRRLRGLGLVRLVPGGRIAPARPETAMARLAGAARTGGETGHESGRFMASLASLRAEAATARGPAAGRPGVERVTDLADIRDRVTDWAFQACDEVLSMTPWRAITPEYLAFARPIALRCLRRGVRFRSIMVAASLDHPPTAAYLAELARHGAGVRLVPEATERLLMSDRLVALLPARGDVLDDGALVVTEPGIIASVAGLFERAWAQAEPYPRPAGLPETERRVLAAMCSGSLDETGARAVGVSVRTYRRRVADLMRQLGAGSRAQAALLARERGWI